MKVFNSEKYSSLVDLMFMSVWDVHNEVNKCVGIIDRGADLITISHDNAVAIAQHIDKTLGLPAILTTDKRIELGIYRHGYDFYQMKIRSNYFSLMYNEVNGFKYAVTANICHLPNINYHRKYAESLLIKYDEIVKLLKADFITLINESKPYYNFDVSNLAAAVTLHIEQGKLYDGLIVCCKNSTIPFILTCIIFKSDDELPHCVLK